MQERSKHPTNGAIAVIDEILFEQLFDLPDAITVRGIYLDPMRRAIVLHLAGDSLPLLVAGQEAERVQLICEQIHDSDGRIRQYLRLVLPDGGQTDDGN